MQIRPADAAPLDVNDDLVGCGFRFGDGRDAQVVCSVELGGLHCGAGAGGRIPRIPSYPEGEGRSRTEGRGLGGEQKRVNVKRVWYRGLKYPTEPVGIFLVLLGHMYGRSLE